MGKITDFKIVKTNINPSFIGKQISLEDVTHFTDGIVKPTKPRKPKQAPDWFKTFELNNTNLLKSILERLTTLESDVVDVKTTLIEHTERMDKHWGAGK
ncbi:hypothetical protein FACS1894166_02750 [Bacilli bacterium]|nr:hypothetical protein FACS1894166_02750 [Bacilli bacterium]